VCLIMSQVPRPPDSFTALRKQIMKLLKDRSVATSQVRISCRTLSPEEALGNPCRDDFPLQKGREKLMQAEIGPYRGQAFTDRPGNLEGTLEEILLLPPLNNFNRAAIIAALNALLRSRNDIEATVHCRDEGPRLCGEALVDHISQKYGCPKVVLIGLQPAMAEALARSFPLSIYDLDPANRGKKFSQTVVETGSYDVADLEKGCDLFIVTGSTIINGSIDQFLGLKKPVIFFGTTIAGPAQLLALNRFCSQAQ
jgi:uncharacterized protein (DUF4213/DUF364 family)